MTVLFTRKETVFNCTCYPVPCVPLFKQVVCLWHCASLIALFILPVTVIADTSETDDASLPFSLSFLQNGGQGVDLDDFLQGSVIAAGTYRVDIAVNQTLVGRKDVRFVRHAQSGRVEACLTAPLLEALGINLQPLQKAGLVDDTQPERCHELKELLNPSSVEFDAGSQTLDINVPQASMLRNARGYVDPELWDAGVAAAHSNYNLNARQTRSPGRTSQDYTLTLRNGVNLGYWRLINESNLVSNPYQGTLFKSNRTFAQRDITALKSQLTLGTAFTNAHIFDSVRIRGVMLDSDEAMLPESQRGYAPTIHGDALSNATVEIRQNDYLLYSTNVAPGPFVIDDIYPNGSNGDLEITIIEADGQRRVFTQAYASLPQMVRQGRFRQNLAFGHYERLGPESQSPPVASAGLAYGVSENTTLFGGAQWATGFRAINLGATRNTPLGAFSLDVTQSSSNATKRINQGQSTRLLYAKTLASTDTTFTLASYRYSTEGYRTLSQHMTDMYQGGRYPLSGRAKTRFDLTLNQSLGQRKYGSLYLTLGEQRYWNLPEKSRQFTLGHSGHWGSLSYNLSATKTFNPFNSRKSPNTTRATLTLSMPFGSGGRTTNIRTILTHDSQSGDNLQAGINGRVMGSEDTTYALGAGYDRRRGDTFNVSLNGTTAPALVNAGYSRGENFSTLNASASGSVVAHAGGVNFGHPLGESFTLVHVPGKSGISVGNHGAITTAANGYAVLPHSQPYRSNWINLDSSQLGADIDIDRQTQQVTPRRGSVTVARFEVQQGRRVQFELIRADGTPMPFGTRVENMEGKQLAIADPKGRALVLVESDTGTLRVKTGALVCEAGYALSERINAQGYDLMKLICR